MCLVCPKLIPGVAPNRLVAEAAVGSCALVGTTDKNLLFARPPVLSAARVRENWFLVSPSMGRSYQGRIRCQMPFLRQLLPALGVSLAEFGRGGSRGSRIEPRPPSARAHPTLSRLGDAVFFSRSGRSHSRVPGPHPRTVRRCTAPADQAGAAWPVGRARRRGGGESSPPPVGHQ